MMPTKMAPMKLNNSVQNWRSKTSAVLQFQHKDGSERKKQLVSTQQPAYQAEEKKVAAAALGLSAQCSAATEFSASLLGSLLNTARERCEC